MTELEAERNAILAENAKLKTVMIAAAEELQAHWDAHCDAEGYGPANLMRRLEEGIPSEYGYTAGAFAALLAERDALLAALLGASRNLRHWRDEYDEFRPTVAELTDAIQRIDAARAGGGE